MAKRETYGYETRVIGNAEDVIEILQHNVLGAQKVGWKSLEFETPDYLRDSGTVILTGIRPRSSDEIKREQEKRRKMYERLKKEFE